MSSTTGRRCTQCGLTWPSDTRYYVNCPACGIVTSVMTTNAVMPDEEALSRLNGINFDRHCRGEKLLPAPTAKPVEATKSAVTPNHIRLERLRKFEGVIRGAGFTIAELDQLKELEESISLMPHCEAPDNDVPDGG
jgi:hypothetical protein